MIHSLRRKFIALTMAIVAVLLLVIFGLVIHFTGKNLEVESIRFLQSAAQTPHKPGPQGQLRLPCFVVRVTPWGQSIQSGGGFDLSDEQMLTEIVALAVSAGEDVGILTDYSLRYYRSQQHGELTLAFTDISAEQATLRSLNWICAGIGTAAFAVFWLVSILLARWAVRPVERAWQEQRQFVADASHELKTPLTVILTNADLLQAPGIPQEQQSQYAHSILAMSQRMRALVESLLELARVDNGAVRVAFEEVDFSGLVNEELLPFEPLYFEQSLELVSQIEDSLKVSGSPRHLRQTLGILLDNAMKYSPGGSTVRLTLTRQGAHALLTLSNPGGPMSREECQSIFRRFYRMDSSRSTGGYGLGLPIARGIIADHGGKIWAESHDGQIFFRIQLPLHGSKGLLS